MLVQYVLVAALLGYAGATGHDALATHDLLTLRARGLTNHTCSSEMAAVRKEWYVEINTFASGDYGMMSKPPVSICCLANEYSLGHNCHVPKSWTTFMPFNALQASQRELLPQLHQEQRIDMMTLW